MLTTCTACGTQFRVSTGQLRAVHGLVRCSRCHSVFDAFETLREEFEIGPSAAVRTLPPMDSSGASHPAATAADEVLPPIPPPAVSASAERAIPDIRLEFATAPPPVDDLFGPLWGEAAPPPRVTPPIPEDEEIPHLIEDHISIAPALMRDKLLYKNAALPPRDSSVAGAPRSSRTRRAWAVGAVLMAGLLGAQWINAHRGELGHSAWLGPPLGTVYAALGHPLHLPPTLGKWQVSGVNVTSDPELPGALSITGALANRAGFAQPWPVLRVVLTDRDGNPLRARDFTAHEYLSAGQTNPWLGPGMAMRFRLNVVDPGPDAVGFEVRPCSKLTGDIHCNRTTGVGR